MPSNGNESDRRQAALLDRPAHPQLFILSMFVTTSNQRKRDLARTKWQLTELILKLGGIMNLPATMEGNSPDSPTVRMFS
jgi:hypothetical protein